MSRPRYMLHRNSTLSIVVDVENLITYIYQITNNEKQFPKAYRYTLVSDLRNTCLDLYKNIYKAISINLRHKKDLKRKQKFQKRVYENIFELKGLLIIATKVAHINNTEFVAKLMSTISESYNKWVRNDIRKNKRLPSKKEYEKSVRERQEYQKAWLSIPRDKDGFIHLQWKDNTHITT